MGKSEEGQERSPQITSLRRGPRAVPARPGPALGHPLEGAPDAWPDEVSPQPRQPGKGPAICCGQGPPGKTLFWACGTGARACNPLLGGSLTRSLPRAVIIRSRHKLP